MPRAIANALLLCLVCAGTAAAQAPAGGAMCRGPGLPYSPSLDLSSMDKSVDPCVDFYHYACGAWQKKNPIPPDQTSWSVYAKLFEDNLSFLRGMLEQAASNAGTRDQVTQEVGDFYAACMDEATVEQRGLSPLRTQLESVAALKSAAELPPLIAGLQRVHGRRMMFAAGSTQDPDNSEQVIAELDQGGLGLPDRDYYTKEDAKSKETRARYLEHVQKIFELMGENAVSA